MKAMVIKRDDSLGKLHWMDTPAPKLDPNQLLIKVKAAGVNRADILQLQGQYSGAASPSEPTIAGLEAAGEVVDTGEAVSGFVKGDRVTGLCPGGYAEFAAMDCRFAIPVPECINWISAAALPLGYMTEYNALKINGRLKQGMSVLISAVSSGVGVAAVQLARFFKATPVIGISGSPEKAEKLASLGLDRVIDSHSETIVDAIRQTTDGRGVDVIVDHVGGSFLKDGLRALAIKGRLISVGRLDSALGELDMELLALNRLRVIGVTFRTRTLEEKIAIVQGVISDILPAIADKTLRPVVDCVFPLHEADEAHKYMQSGKQVGKIVLTLG